ncbi:MAG: archaeal proteasome endopeptidase complex subunit alpha [Halobacteriales archaeon]
MQQNEQMAYDRGSTIFSPDGRLYQVEYAREAVKRGSVSVGVKTSESVVLIAEKRVASDLLVSRSIEKIYQIDDHIAVAASGHVADARQLVDFARLETQRNTYMYEEDLDTETLAKALGDHIQQYTQYGGTRPFGCALLVGGYTRGEPRLIESEPSGAIIGYKAAGIGENRAVVEDELEAGYADDLTTDEGLELGLRAMAEADETDVESVEAAVVDEDGYHVVEHDRIVELSPDDTGTSEEPPEE